ncbi:hypothetical protein ACFX13_041988 [Malus domestica]
MATSNFSVSIQLFIDTNRKKVLFAEAGKDFVDLLFGLLSLSDGDVIKLLSGHGMVRCLDKIYGSLENLSPKYTLPNLDKNILLLHPCVEEGYVRDFTYMVMDDLEVKPLSTVSILDVLNKSDVKDVGKLDVVVVHLGWQEGLELLRGSLLSNSNLTGLFLGEEVLPTLHLVKLMGNDVLRISAKANAIYFLDSTG